MQISLSPEEHRRVKLRAAERGISAAEYIRRLVKADGDGGRPSGGIEAIFGLGESGRSDISSRVDDYVGEAVLDDYERSTGKTTR